MYRNIPTPRQLPGAQHSEPIGPGRCAYKRAPSFKHNKPGHAEMQAGKWNQPIQPTREHYRLHEFHKIIAASGLVVALLIGCTGQVGFVHSIQYLPCVLSRTSGHFSHHGQVFINFLAFIEVEAIMGPLCTPS